MAHDRPQPGDDVVQLIGDRLGRHGLGQRPVAVRQVAQQHPLRALQAVAGHVLVEGVGALEHVPGHRLGAGPVPLHPGVVAGEHLEGPLDEIGLGPGPGHLGQAAHPLLVLDPLGLHPAHQLVLDPVELGHQHHRRVLDDRLHQAQRLQVVVGRGAVQHRHRLHREQRQGLVEPELVLEVEPDPHRAAQLVGLVQHLDDPGVGQRPEHAHRPADVVALAGPGLVVVDQQPLHGRAAVAGPVQDVEHHGVGHPEARLQGLGRSGGQADQGVAVVVGVTPLGRLLADRLAALAAPAGRGYGRRLDLGPLVLDDVLGGLHPHAPGLVEAPAAGPPRDLLEVPHRQHPSAAAVVLEELGEQHGADRHVHPHPQGVGAAYQSKLTLLGQLLHQQPVLGEQAGVVDADARGHEAPQVLADGSVEAEPAHRLAHRCLLGRAQHVEAGEALSPGRGLLLGEVDDVDRRLAPLQQLLHRHVQRGLAVLEVQGHRPLRRGHQGGVAPGPGGQVGPHPGGVAQGGRHEQELGPAQLQQRHLPGPAPVPVAVVVDLVHHHEVGAGGGPGPQGPVGQDFGRAGDHRGAAVDGGVAGDHAHPIGAEGRGQLEELLAHQRLDRRGVDGPPAPGQRREDPGHRHQRLPRPGGGGQHHVVVGQQVQHRLLLMLVELEAGVGRPLLEGVQQLVGVAAGRHPLAQRRGAHGVRSPQAGAARLTAPECSRRRCGPRRSRRSGGPALRA